jgi:hypothetical protein
MKKIFLLLSILLSLCMMTNNCISEKIEEKGQDEPPGSDPTDPDEKIYFVRFVLSPMSGISPLNMDWANYRTAGLFINGSNPIHSNRRIDITEESGFRDVLWYDTIVTSDADGLGFAYAPHKDFSGTTITGTLTEAQDQTIDNVTWVMDESVKNNMLLVADPASFKLDQSTCRLVLKNMFSLLRLKVIKSPSLVMNNRTVKNIRLYIADANDLLQPINSTPLSGSYTMNLSENPAVPQFTSLSYSVSAAISGYATIRDNPEIWNICFAVNPFTLSNPNEKLVARVVTNGDDVIYSSFPDDFRSLAGNTVYDYTITASEENTYLERTSDQYLHAYSNCYLITEKGKYAIPADKTMNGTPLSGSKVDWLWASKEGGGTFQISDLMNLTAMSYVGSRIFFQVGGDNPFSRMPKGNVVLALKDADDNIVWTWHIWMTDAPRDLCHGGKVFLDRNIGALSADTLSSPAVDTYGFLYQWGRKDPFFGGDGLLSDESTGVLSVARAHTIVNSEGTASWGAHVAEWSQADMSDASVEESIKHPMRFFYNRNSPNVHDPADWLSPNDPELWSDERKTDYDPCPYGYKVPKQNDFSTLHHVYGDYWDFKYRQRPEPLIWFYNRDSSNRYWTYYNHAPEECLYRDFETAWPLAGMRQGRHMPMASYGAQLITSGTDGKAGYGYYWTSTPWKVDGRVIPGLSYSLYMRDVLYSEDTGGANADAYSVRCVKE